MNKKIDEATLEKIKAFFKKLKERREQMLAKMNEKKDTISVDEKQS